MATPAKAPLMAAVVHSMGGVGQRQLIARLDVMQRSGPVLAPRQPALPPPSKHPRQSAHPLPSNHPRQSKLRQPHALPQHLSQHQRKKCRQMQAVVVRMGTHAQVAALEPAARLPVGVGRLRRTADQVVKLGLGVVEAVLVHRRASRRLRLLLLRPLHQALLFNV